MISLIIGIVLYIIAAIIVTTIYSEWSNDMDVIVGFEVEEFMLGCIVFLLWPIIILIWLTKKFAIKYKTKPVTIDWENRKDK